ncbi:MAG: hypothetical protein K2N29_00580 [Ruminiclostridium sp.]|nr:hypothetical protein [Ruminiclostridium sp.]
MKKIKLLFCAAILLLSSCANTVKPPSETTTAPETADTTSEEDPVEPRILVDIRGRDIGIAEFSSVAETLNVDGKCYGKSYIFDNNKNEETPAELTASGLTYEMLDSAEPIGVGCSADGTVAYNDFRAEAREYFGSKKGEVYRVNDEFMLCKTERTVEEARTPYDPPERYDGYEDGDIITTYYLFRYEESATEYARVGRLLYEVWKFDRETFRISDVVLTDNIVLHRQYFTVTVGRGGEEPLRELLERENVDESLVEIVSENF